MDIVISVLIGYLLGCINPALIIARFKNVNLRSVGTKNPGATNTFVSIGKKAGVFVMLFDMFKAFLAVIISGALFGFSSIASIFAGAAAIIGHMYPVFMRMHGGKGTACLGGVIIGLDWRLFIPMVLVCALIAFIINHLSAMPCAAAALFPFVYSLITKCVVCFFVLAFPCAIILYKHRENIRGMIDKTEPKFRDMFKKA